MYQYRNITSSCATIVTRLRYSFDPTTVKKGKKDPAKQEQHNPLNLKSCAYLVLHDAHTLFVKKSEKNMGKVIAALPRK